MWLAHKIQRFTVITRRMHTLLEITLQKNINGGLMKGQILKYFGKILNVYYS